jgi:hypothetical protein
MKAQHLVLRGRMGRVAKLPINLNASVRGLDPRVHERRKKSQEIRLMKSPMPRRTVKIQPRNLPQKRKRRNRPKRQPPRLTKNHLRRALPLLSKRITNRCPTLVFGYWVRSVTVHKVGLLRSFLLSKFKLGISLKTTHDSTLRPISGA